MKRIVLLCLTLSALTYSAFSQNVFDPNDPIVRYSASAAYGSPQKPDSNIVGLQKWVANLTNGVSTGSGSFRTLSETYKAYFINYYGVLLTFRVKYPKSYLNADSANKKYPVMLFMHGAGEAACPSNGGIYNNEIQLFHGGKLFAERVDNNLFDGFLVYPQLRSKDGGCWGEWATNNSIYNTVLTFIDSMSKYARADIDRLFVDGLSGGGFAVWRLAESYPQRIAKIAPTSAAGLGINHAPFVHIPMWLATGGKDSYPTPAMANYTVDRVRELGGDIRQSLYPDLGHSSWYRHWEEPDFVAYMNDVHKANPLIFFNRFEFCPDSAISARLGITGGFYAYEWEKDGVLIATRTGSTNTVINSAPVISFTGNEITVRSFGSYRVRFRRVNNGPWSDWSPKPAVIKPKTITQTPPIQVVGTRSSVLPGLDGRNSVMLQLPPGFLNYQWVRVSDNVRVNATQTYDAPVGAYKARYSEPYGCGTEYSPVFTVVNANGTPKPDPAKNLAATALSQTALRLDWSDNPNAGTNETGFEIYRAATAGGPYTLLSTTAANAISFVDTALKPNTSYYYKVRAVAGTGAAAASNEASGKTEIDNQAPSAPADLEYRGSTVSTVSLRWKAASDNVGILRYDIFANGTKLYSTSQLSFTVGNLDSLTSYTFVVQAVDKAGNPSQNSNQVLAYTHRQGLNYQYYHGSFNSLPDFNTLTPQKTGVMDTVNTGPSVRTQSDNYAFLWQGKIFIPESANYTFETSSDDGSKLYIDVPYAFGATALVNNDGAHSSQIRTGVKYLTQGYHDIAVSFSEITGDEEMSLFWSSSAGLVRERIPKNVFTTGDPSVATAVTAPSVLAATAIAYNKIRLSWTDNSANETGFEIVRSTSMTGTFAPVTTTGPNATSYTDSGLAANTQYFYKIRSIGTGGSSPYTFAFTEANWKFNQNYTDANGGGSSLSLTGSGTTFSATEKKEGSHGVEFTSNDVINFNAGASGFPSLGGYNQRSVALWLKPSATNSKRMIFEFGGSDNGLALRFNGNALIAGIASNNVVPAANVRNTITLNNFASSAQWLSGQWNHVAVVYDNNRLALYVNGVEVASNNALAFAGLGNSSNASRLGNNNSNNAFNDNTSYTTYLGWMDDMYVIRGALSASQIDSMRAGAFQPSSATTPAAPAAPVAPDQVLATASSTSTVELSWRDNAADETGFEIWRASGDRSDNRRIALLGAGTDANRSFTDTSLFANVTYYYKVRAAGVAALSDFSAEDSARTWNTRPVITKVRSFTMKYGTSFVLPIKAADPDGDVLTFSSKNLPTFAAIQNISNGSIEVTLTPSITRRGTYVVSFYVDDANGGRDTTMFSLKVDNNGVPVLSPVQDTVNLNEGAEFTQQLSATDDHGPSRMIWSFEGLPSFATFTNNNDGTGSLLFKPGYAQSGQYELTITLNDGYGAWTSRTMFINIIDKVPDERVQLDFRTQVPPVQGWNAVDIVAPSTLNHGVLMNTANTASTIRISLTRGSIAASTIGWQTGNNSGVYPDAVMKDLIIWGFNQGTNAVDSIDLKVTGLEPNKTYNFTFHSGYTMNGTTSFKIGSSMVTQPFFQNTANTVTLQNIQPNAAGEVLITAIGDPSTSRGGILNAMVVQANFADNSAPVKPLALAGSHQQNAGVQLTWQDRAFNETAYQVFRATDRAGSYTLLNPNSTNKDSVSYLDGAALPQTAYYYYVVGVNAAGAGIASDTISVTTGNNTPAILLNNVYAKTGATENTDFAVTDDQGDLVTVSLEEAPAFVALQSLASPNYRLVTTAGTDHIGSFTITLRAADNKGGVTHKTISLLVSDKNTRSVFVNFGNVGKTAPLPWNNWLGARTNTNAITNLRDERNTVTPFGITLTSTFSGFNDLGHLTGNNGGVYPDSVLQSGLVDLTGPRTIRFDGLNVAKRYNLVFMGSMNEGGNAQVEYAAGTTKDTLNARYNTTQTANLNGLTPNASGQITVTLSRINGSVGNYLNAVVIEEYEPGITILNPLNLRAEPMDRNVIELSWSDRTVDEDLFAGYLLERATDSLFTQNQVSIPLPANTSNYRNAGLTPNTRYWYRVRAKNSAGAFSDYSNRAKGITPASIMYLNFNYTLPDAPYPWNNTFAGPTIEVTFDSLINQSGAVSGLSFTLTRYFNGEFTAGMNTGNNSGVVPDKALASNYWLDNTQVSGFRVSGLNHARRYRFGFFGSSSPNGWFKGNYTATYTINGRTAYLNSWLNTTKIVYIDDVMPDENGEVNIDFSTTQEAAYGFNGGVIVQDYTVPGTAGGVVGSQAVLSHAVGGSPVLPQALFETLQSVPSDGTIVPVTGMYPNPFRDFMNVDFVNSSASDNISMEVYDLAGRMIYRRRYGKLSAGSNTLRLNASEAGLKTGMYIVTVSANGKVVQAGKVVKNGK